MVKPANGKVIRRFHDTVANSKIKFEAMHIKLHSSDRINAVDNGKVIYANWAPHFGNLLIIEHKNKILSIYGHNSELIVKTNQTVRKGQKIALAGQSGNTNSVKLYFAIKVNEDNVDPEKFIKF